MKIRILIALLAVFTISCNQKQKQMENNDLQNNNLIHLLSEPKHYVCYYTDKEINIDGNIEKEIWKKADWTDLFVDIEGDLKPLPNQKTRVKMLWDSTYLYIAAELEEEHIWAYLENHDDIVFRDNDFEVFIDPDNDAKNYFEYEINARQTVFDLFLPHPYRHSSFALHNWDFKGVKHAVKIFGTLNNGNDKDEKWTVEIAIPFTDLSFGLDNGKPTIDKPWRINFSRVEWDTRWENGKYVKLTDNEGKQLAEQNWVWSPVGAISMHMPERYGYLKFSDKLAGTEKETFKISDKEKLKSILWAVFYQQEKYFEKNKIFSSDINELGIQQLKLYNPNDYKLSIYCGEHIYEAKLESIDGNIKMYITNEGSINDCSK